ncbi:hypothetical protein K438DRAFT_1749705 [Mycena galopus ATCC 62051]|nr:hypothetical protein K438DRAFT_1749705 [Mycena galopus ATCC 62051]
MSTLSAIAQYSKFPPRDRIPNNSTILPYNWTILGFHERRDLLLGFQLYPDTPRDRKQETDLIGPDANADWMWHDLALQYVYDTETYCDLEGTGELLPYPITRYVYRRDRELRWGEVKAYLLTGAIPSRYPPREHNGCINEPMNDNNFKKLMRRFCLKTQKNGFQAIYERGSRLPVQYDYDDFEYWFWAGLATRWASRSVVDDGLGVEDTVAIHALVLRHGARVWYLNGARRAAQCIHYYRTGKLLPRPIDEYNDAGFRGRNPKTTRRYSGHKYLERAPNMRATNDHVIASPRDRHARFSRLYLVGRHFFTLAHMYTTDREFVSTIAINSERTGDRHATGLVNQIAGAWGGVVSL